MQAKRTIALYLGSMESMLRGSSRISAGLGLPQACNSWARAVAGGCGSWAPPVSTPFTSHSMYYRPLHVQYHIFRITSLTGYAGAATDKL